MPLNPFTAMVSFENNKGVKFEPLILFVFSFAQACEWISIKTHIIENRCVIGLESTLSAGVFVHLSAGKLYRLEQ